MNTFRVITGHHLKLALTIVALNTGIVHAEEVSPFADHEISVLSALINHGVAIDTPIVVIADYTTGDPATVSADKDTVIAIVEKLGIPRATVDDWSYRNVTKHLINQPLDIDMSYQMLSEMALEELFGDSEPDVGWNKFFTRYSGAPGLLRVSRVGFDDSLSHALVYIEYQCGTECGAGRLVHLTRTTEGQWNVREGAVVWLTE